MRHPLLCFAALVVACGDPIDLEAPGSEVVQTVAVEAGTTLRPVKLDCRSPGTSDNPLVLFGHGFLIPPTQYDSYAQHLATHGFLACTVDFVTGLTPNHSLWATDYRAAIDALILADADPASPLFGKLDPEHIGLAGHSLGGKLAVLAAKEDPRVKAVFGVDPVDGQEPDATDLLPLSIPLGVIGETIDATATGMACAPAEANYTTFFDAAAAPALEITALGANHLSFLDEQSSCELVCEFCNPATVPDAEVNALTRAYLVAFFGRYLADRDYDSQLNGDEAERRYVETRRITIRSR